MIKVFGRAADDYPLLWDKNYNVKSSYVGFHDGLIENNSRKSGDTKASFPQHEIEKLEKHIESHRKYMVEELGFPEHVFDMNKQHTLSNIEKFGSSVEAINELAK